jgi:hypothetical protein
MHLVQQTLKTCELQPSGGIAGAAERRLRNSPYPSVRTVSCEHRHGVLFLRGRVPTYYYKQVALAAVARLDGVMRIVNEIEVSQEAPRRRDA